MVKQAEVKRKRSPLLPVFGLIIGIGLFAVAYGLEGPLQSLINRFAPSSGFNINTLDNVGKFGIAFVIWLVLLALAYMLVAILAGKDPDSAKDIQLPPRTKEERDRRYK